MAEKGIHNFEHKADVHCTATDKHFHQLEHTCSICEFTLTHATDPLVADFQFNISVQELLFYPFVESINVPEAFQYLPARAPPVA